MALAHRIALRLGLAFLVVFVLVGQAAASSIPPSWLVTFWTWDPQDASGHASDANSCTDVSKPCRTFDRIVQRLGTDAPRYTNGIAVSFHALSGVTNGNDPIHLHPFLDVTSTVTFDEALPTPCAATLSATVHKNLAVGTLPSETAAACLTGVGQLIVNTDRVSSTAFTSRAIAGNNFDVTQPFDTTNFVQVNNWTDGDHVNVYTLNALSLSDFGMQQGSFGFMGFSNIGALNASGHDSISLNFESGFAQVTNCRIDEGVFDDTALFGTSFLSSVLNGPAGASELRASGLEASSVSNGNLTFFGTGGFAGDDTEFFGGGANLRIDGQFGWGSVFLSVIAQAQSGAAIVIQSGGNFDPTAGAHVWGNGSPDGFALLITTLKSIVNVQSTTAVSTLLLTTANPYRISGSTTACNTSNANPDVIKCAISLTAANLDLSIGGGGFGGQAFVPGLGAFVLGFI